MVAAAQAAAEESDARKAGFIRGFELRRGLAAVAGAPVPPSRKHGQEHAEQQARRPRAVPDLTVRSVSPLLQQASFRAFALRHGVPLPLGSERQDFLLGQLEQRLQPRFQLTLSARCPSGTAPLREHSRPFVSTRNAGNGPPPARQSYGPILPPAGRRVLVVRVARGHAPARRSRPNRLCR